MSTFFARDSDDEELFHQLALKPLKVEEDLPFPLHLDLRWKILISIYHIILLVPILMTSD
jgi:hypothetical protein